MNLFTLGYVVKDDPVFYLIRLFWRNTGPFLFVCIACQLGHGQAKIPDSVITWQVWEHTLTSKLRYPQPYQTVSLTATFTSPGGQSFSVPGFWATDRTVKIRCAFPASGVWKWETMCSDAKNKVLHRQSGQVSVSAYSGENPLYRHGFLRVGDSKRHLIYNDGTPFFWMGDTGWLAFRQSSMTEWQTYIDNRAAKGFTIIQIHASQYALKDTALTDIAPLKNHLPDPDYFNNLEDKIAYANQRGLVILLVGLGLSGKGYQLPDMNTVAFIRYLTGRLAGHAVIFSPSMDAPYNAQNDQMAALIKATSSIHLVTQHVGTVAGAAETYHVKPHIDFTSFQSGHHNGNTEKAYGAAVKWAQNLWRLEPTKPVINSEAMYDGRGNNEGANWREQDARKLGWCSWLSGALGYTYGAGETDHHVTGSHGGLFRFVKDRRFFDYWEKVLEWPSATQMSYLTQFFRQLVWWELEPAPDRILNQAKSPLQTMTLALNQSGSVLVAYLPENHDIRMNMNGLQRGLSGKWFNPVYNQYYPLTESIINTGEQTFQCPGPGDWVLLLTK